MVVGAARTAILCGKSAGREREYRHRIRRESATRRQYASASDVGERNQRIALYRNLNFNFMLDTEPVASIARIPLVMEENVSVPAKTVPEFIAYAEANPSKINMAAGGNGTPLYVAGQLFKMMASVDLTDVSYQGEAAAMPDLISGQVQVMFGVTPASLGYIKSGKLRALAVTTAARQQVLPDVPAMAEFLPGYEASGWYGVVVPKGTPKEIIDKLNKEINAALADPTINQRLTDLGCAVFAGSPAEFGAFIAAETEKWAKVIKFAGIKQE
jgi:tripartite-type tricarboxylate transporter receptor subunit TctC